MKKKNFGIFIILLVFSSGILFKMTSTQVNGWGLATHQFIVREASNVVSDDWKEAFSYYLPEIVSGSTYPDQVLQDWQNHLYYPITGENNAPWHINNTIYGIRSNITNNEDWETIFWLLGILSHYISDINIPVHTDEYWDGHPAYETDINNHLNELNVTVYSFDDFDDPVDFAIECATYAHQYYWAIRNAYPTGSETDVIITNNTIKTITEEQLGRAIGATLKIWEYTLEDFTPPDVEIRENVATILVDRYHDNDYSLSTLTSFFDTLNRDVVEMLYNEAEISENSLSDIDLLVITAPYRNFSTTEISTISNWYSSGGHLLISSRGDFSNASRGTLNELLGAINSELRINDDNIYTTPADPEFYKPWYCQTDEFNDDDPIAAQIVGNLTKKVQFFSPTSLYTAEESSSVHWLIFGEETFYQSDQNPPAPDIIYDNTDDNVGGTSIPLAAVELDGDSSLALFGTTTWSNYDFGLSDRDNKDLIWSTIEFLLDIDLQINNVNNTTPTDNTTLQKTPGASIICISLSILISAIVVKKKKRK